MYLLQSNLPIYIPLLQPLSNPVTPALKLIYKKIEPCNKESTFFSGMKSLLDNFKQVDAI